jgi:DNA replication protein DnaC
LRLERERIDRLQRHSNLGPLAHLTFDTLSPQGRNGENRYFEKAYIAAKEFASDPKGWILFYGPSGCGKTHLACAIANFCLKQGNPVLFIVTLDLLDYLRASFSPKSDVSYDELFQRVENTPLLILDDFSIGVITPWASDKLSQIISFRYNAQLPMVVTTKVHPEEIEQSFRDRLLDPSISKVLKVGEEGVPCGLEPALLNSMTFDNFDSKRVNLPLEQRRNLGQAFKLARSFAQAPEGWLTIQGTSGCGKTHLACAIANFCLKQGREIHFIFVPDLLEELRMNRGQEIFQQAKKNSLLILDDLGPETFTAWASDKLYQILNFRYNCRLSTIITTCLSLEEIDIRMGSRMADPKIGVVFNITAPDFRTDRGEVRQGKFSSRGR